ncbi:MAG TPA: glycogen debranching protein [Lentisphaeria bacterium]|nr:glycogen debranching protein [Lentisphaeria bacterium]
MILTVPTQENERESALFSQEWILTNGRGGYASTTVAGCNTRKYHGLLVAALPDAGKLVFLNRLEVTATVDGQVYELGTACYPGAIAPRGHALIKTVECDPVPSITHSCGPVEITQSFLMPRDQATTLVRFAVRGSQQVSFSMRPFTGYRSMHCLTKRNDTIDLSVQLSEGRATLSPYPGLPRMLIDAAIPLDFQEGAAWYYNNEYGWERDRGFDHHEDLPTPGTFSWRQTASDANVVRFTIENPKDTPAAAWALASPNHRVNGNPIELLAAKADDFIVTNGRNERSIIAGYHWFGEWGRDAMIALPGLTLARDLPELAREILETYALHEKDGLIPNYLAATSNDSHSYNSIDASLWFTRALQLYAQVVGPAQVPATLVRALSSIIKAYLDDLVPYAHLESGAIWAGSVDTQLTWMDANAYGRPVTPRHGFAIELNALWFNALCFRDELAQNGHPAADPRMGEVREQLQGRFVRTFWMESAGHFADVVNEHGQNGLLRPNQVFALALPYRAFPDELGERALRAVRDNLLTPFGLRTLAPKDPGFCARYSGDSDQRDSAYHQGTVWPWLIGAYVDAELALSRDPEHRAAELMDYLRPLWDEHVRQAGIGGISEIFDATAPQHPNGCITQAWSVSELLRVHKNLMQHLQP